jgi:hypothetical protein
VEAGRKCNNNPTSTYLRGLMTVGIKKKCFPSSFFLFLFPPFTWCAGASSSSSNRSESDFLQQKFVVCSSTETGRGGGGRIQWRKGGGRGEDA